MAGVTDVYVGQTHLVNAHEQLLQQHLVILRHSELVHLIHVLVLVPKLALFPHTSHMMPSGYSSTAA